MLQWLTKWLPWRWSLFKRDLYSMQVVCAWCGAHMLWRTCTAPGKISHGICDPCIKKSFPTLWTRVKALKK